MTNPPLTKEDAQKLRYNVWAGNPKGSRFKDTCCAHEVYRNPLFFQCNKKPVSGPDNLYCKVHANKVARRIAQLNGN